MRSKYLIFTLLAILTMIASACGPQATPTQAPPTVAAPTQAPAATQASAAAPTGPATVDVAQNDKFGSILVDDKGMSLYLFTNDTPNTSTCYDKCATFWPPLLTAGSAVAGTGVDASKFGTTTRKDGTTQVTYNSWPLYYFSKDKQAGDVAGQGVTNNWYVVSPTGDAIKSAAQASATQAPAASAPSGPAMVNVGKNDKLGSILVDDKGMTLYLYTKDTPNAPTCYDKCATAWPPLLTTGNAVAGAGLDASKFGTAARTDGTTQVTYNGWPLYYFAKDTQAGDVARPGRCKRLVCGFTHRGSNEIVWSSGLCFQVPPRPRGGTFV